MYLANLRSGKLIRFTITLIPLKVRDQVTGFLAYRNLPGRGRVRLSRGQTLCLLSAQLHDRQLRAGIDSHIDTSVKPSLYRSNHQKQPLLQV